MAYRRPGGLPSAVALIPGGAPAVYLQRGQANHDTLDRVELDEVSRIALALDGVKESPPKACDAGRSKAA